VNFARESAQRGVGAVGREHLRLDLGDVVVETVEHGLVVVDHPVDDHRILHKECASLRDAGYDVSLIAPQAGDTRVDGISVVDGAGPWKRFRHITLPLLRPLIAIQLLFGVIYAAYQYTIPIVMFGSNPGPDADLMMTLIVRQSFSNNLFGFGSAVSVLLMMAMFVWVAIWYRAFKRDLEVA